jgi:hypothetical protein
VRLVEDTLLQGRDGGEAQGTDEGDRDSREDLVVRGEREQREDNRQGAQ